MEWGLCSPPTRGDCPFTAHSHLPPSTSLGEAPRASSQGASFTLFHQDSGLTVLFPGSSARFVTLTRIQSQVTRAAFLDHTHHLLVHSQLRPERPPWAPSPMALPGALSPLQPGSSLSCPLQGHQELPLPGQAVCPGEASVVSGARNNRHPWGLPTQYSGQLLPPDLFTLDGPRLGSGAPPWVLVLISSQCCPRGSH